MKGLTRVGYDGAYETLSGKTSHLKVRDSRGQTIHEENVTFGDYGTFTAHFALDAKASPGTYNMSVGEGYGSFASHGTGTLTLSSNTLQAE